MKFKPSPAAFALLKEFEKGPNGDFAAEPYTCPAGKRTVGWGHVMRSDDCFTYPLTEERADGILRRDLERLARPIRQTILRTLKQCQIDALLCSTSDSARSSAARCLPKSTKETTSERPTSFHAGTRPATRKPAP